MTFDELFWSKLPGFWARYLSEGDRGALEGFYTAAAHMLDAEYVNLADLRNAVSVHTCPLNTQRRWLRLDLTQYDTTKQWLRFLAGERISTDDRRSNTDRLVCYELPEVHPRHWHLSFPFVGKLLTFAYPMVESLTEFYQGGIRLLPGIHYSFSADRLAVEFTTDVAVEALVAVDISEAKYDGLTAGVFEATDFTSPNTFHLPPGFLTGFPLHGLLVRGYSPYRTPRDREFVPLQYGVTGQAALSPEVVIGPADRLFVFGLKQGDWDVIHTHESASVDLTAGNAYPTGTLSVELPVFPQEGVFPGWFGRTFQLFIDGRLLHPSNYEYELATNTVHFQTPLVFEGSATLEVHFTSESFAGERLQGAHLHYLCTIERAITKVEYERFDDGGRYDNADDATETFDSTVATNILYLDYELEPGQFRVFVNGVLQRSRRDFVFYKESRYRSRLTFSKTVEGSTILVEFRRQSALYVYGESDIFASIGVGQTLYETVGTLANDVDAKLQDFGAHPSSAPYLEEAARIVQSRGNPLLALFTDEFMNRNAEGQYLSAAAARNVASLDTLLTGLPILVDHVTNPTRMLRVGSDYSLKDGELHSTVDLRAVWWCPLVTLDEQLLAKRFGILVDDIDQSSEAYRGRLIANFMLRYGGATVENVQAAVAAMVGSPVFTADGRVTRVVRERRGWLVTVSQLYSSAQAVYGLPASAVPPAIGQPVLPGQSVLAPLVAQVAITEVLKWTGQTLEIGDLVPGSPQAGDVLRLSIRLDGRDAWHITTLQGVATRPRPGGVSTVLVLSNPTPAGALVVEGESSFILLRDAGAPYSAYRGEITGVEEDFVWVLETSAAERFEIPRGNSVEFKPGDRVRRGGPLYPSWGRIYDDSIRPSWCWSQVQDLRGLGAPATVTSSSFLVGEGHELITSLPLPRGAEVFLEYQGQGTLHQALTPTRLLPPPPVGVSGQISLLSSPQVEPFVLPITPRTTTLALAVNYGASSLHVQSTDGFPSQGLIRIRGALGGMLEVTYRGMTRTRLDRLEWGSDDGMLRQPDGLRAPIIAAGALLTVVAELEDRRLNPAFSAALKQRVAYDPLDGSGQGNVVLTPDTVEEFYTFVKNSTLAVEAVRPGFPSKLRSLLADTLPAGVHPVYIARQVIDDRAQLVPVESARSGDPLLAEIQADAPIISGVLALPDTVTQTALRLIVSSDPGAPEGRTYAWAVRALTGGSPNLELSTPEREATLLRGMVPGSEYRVTCRVTSTVGLTMFLRLTVRFT